MLCLRGFWQSQRIIYNFQGLPESHPHRADWTLSWIKVKRVALNKQRLVLQGRWLGLAYIKASKRLEPVDLGSRRMIVRLSGRNLDAQRLRAIKAERYPNL